jgi:2-hydroxychromene-2-carboxylate isomerase
MTAAFDFYFSFRSPYSYLATPLIVRLTQRLDVSARMRIVTPIAIRIPGFFKTVNPLWPPYLARDTWRIAEMNGIPYRWPRPDPIVMDLGSGEVATEQPYIWPVSRMAVAAERQGKGLAFVAEAARVIWSGEVENWHEGDHLIRAGDRAGLNGAQLAQHAQADAAAHDAEIAQNEADQKAAGHWGVPLFVFEGEPFFGQDRVDVLEWRLKKSGVTPR